MTVADLQKFIKSMSEVLAASGAKSVAGELEHVAEKLGPFADYKLKAFGDFLEKAMAPPKRVPTREQALELVQTLYKQALEPDLTVEVITARVNELSSLSLADLKDVAKRFEITRTLASKAKVLEAITQKITDRKGDYERAKV